MSDSIDRQFCAYLVVCAGVGAMFGAFGGFLFPGFFLPSMYIDGLLVAFIGAGWFDIEVRANR